MRVAVKLPKDQKIFGERVNVTHARRIQSKMQESGHQLADTSIPYQVFQVGGACWAIIKKTTRETITKRTFFTALREVRW